MKKQIFGLIRKIVDAGIDRLRGDEHTETRRTLGEGARSTSSVRESHHARDPEDVEGSPPEPSAPTFALAELARPLGLRLQDIDAENGASVTRHGESRSLGKGIQGLDLSVVRERERAWSALLATRLAIDTAISGWTPEREREHTPERFYQKQEVPSPHGERYPWVVPRHVLEVWEDASGKQAACTAIEGTDLIVLYVLEVGTHLHVLSREDRDALEFKDPEGDARRALFYQSYKVRPSEERRTEDGRLRLYHTREGLGAARILLLPDYDYDASKKRGHVIIASRDHMLVSEPVSDDLEVRERARSALAAWAEELRLEAKFPILAPTIDLPDITAHEDAQAHQRGRDEES